MKSRNSSINKQRSSSSSTPWYKFDRFLMSRSTASSIRKSTNGTRQRYSDMASDITGHMRTLQTRREKYRHNNVIDYDDSNVFGYFDKDEEVTIDFSYDTTVPPSKPDGFDARFSIDDDETPSFDRAMDDLRTIYY